MIRQPPVAQRCDQHEPTKSQPVRKAGASRQSGELGPAAFCLDPAVNGGLMHAIQDMQDGSAMTRQLVIMSRS